MPGSVTNKNGNDRIYTPDWLAEKIVDHFKPKGLMLEPCAGKGAFIHAFQKRSLKFKWCEIDKGRDFFFRNLNYHFSWCITNPPFSLIRRFLEKCCEMQIDNIVFLMYITALVTNNKIATLRNYGYSVKEILLIDNRELQKFGWKQSGFQLAVIHIKRERNEYIKIGKL